MRSAELARIRAALGGRRAISTIAIIVVAVVAVVLVYRGLYRASAESFAANSDGATVVLEGLALRHGHLLLSGWDLSFDSFWLIDATVYAGVIFLTGFHQSVLHVVPSLIALAIVVLGAGIASKGRKLRVAAAASLVMVILLALPSPMLSFFLLQGPWHIGTVLWCLIAFCGFSRAKFGFGWLVAIVALSAALLGDLSTLPIGVIPCAVAAFLAMGRARSLKAGAWTFGGVSAASLLALALRAVVAHVGSFNIAQGVTRAHSAQYPVNVHLAIHYGADLFGLGSIPIGPAPALGAYDLAPRGSLEQAFRISGLVLVLAALALSVLSVAYGLIRGRSPMALSPRRSHLNDLLLCGVAGSIALFIYLCPNGNGDYARYLTPAVIYAALLTTCVVAQLVSRYSRDWVINIALALVVVLGAVGVVSFTRDLRYDDAPQPAIALGNFLEQHHLQKGVGDYWSASLVTVVTNNNVAVRPVIVGRGGTLARYGRQSAADWYGTTKFTFLVFDLARPWRRVDAATATASFGAPATVYRVGTYEVLVWPKGFSVSTTGYTRS
jgi:hypothetical protein